MMTPRFPDVSCQTTDLLQALPVAVYTTDPEGRITFFNDAAEAFWGHRPELGTKWCGSWRLYWPDGRPMLHEECPMAVALREGRVLRGVEALLERPDGARAPFLPYPTLLKDADGRVIGAINVLVDVSDRKKGEIESARLAAIVASSDDAIISKTLDGIVTSWNAASARIFGYSPEEMLGQSIRRIIPTELYSEEDEILAKLARGEHIDHYETTRMAKDGRRVEVSLTVSPVRDGSGKVIGASKIARDVTDRKEREKLESLLLHELNHRVKNTLATIVAIANQSLRTSSSPGEFVTSFTGRVHALARAHDLLVTTRMQGAEITQILQEQVGLEDDRIASSGPPVMLDARLAVQVALVVHELATNARKYGALSVAGGRLSIRWRVRSRGRRELSFEWAESGVPNVKPPTSHGFGTALIERSIKANGGKAATLFGADGIVCTISLPLPEREAEDKGVLSAESPTVGDPSPVPAADSLHLRGKRILLIEDEPLVTLEIEAQLASAGCLMLGPATTIDAAIELVRKSDIDAALVDANLAGRPVDEVAMALAQKGVSFTFVTGYGREALPLAFRQAPLLSKPFSSRQLLQAVLAMFAEQPNLGAQPGKDGLTASWDRQSDLARDAHVSDKRQSISGIASNVIRVLLVEDDPFVADSTRLLIEAMGHSARQASNGAEALAVAKLFRPHLVLCDIGLAGSMDGYAFARAFRQAPISPASRLVALTGYGDKEAIDQSVSSGFDLHLTKPVDVDRLEKLIIETATLVASSFAKSEHPVATEFGALGCGQPDPPEFSPRLIPRVGASQHESAGRDPFT